MTELRTSEALLKALKKASPRSPSYDQLEKQRLSFVMGALPTENDMSREQVQSVLERQEGRTLTLS